MNSDRDTKSATDTVSLSFGTVTGDFIKSKSRTLYAGCCCCCCCCFFWVGGLIGTTVGAVVGVRGNANVKGNDYRFLMRLFWLSVFAFTVFPLFAGLICEDFWAPITIAAVGAPAAQVLLAFFTVLIVGKVRSVQPAQRKTAYRVCLKTIIGCVAGYVIGWLGLLIVFSF